MNTCDKCGQEVRPSNDALLLTVILLVKGGKSIQALELTLFGESRHLLPEGDCEGSPSRAQYLEGQPRDPRGKYPYMPEAEPWMRAAYDDMKDAESVTIGVVANGQRHPLEGL